MTDDALRLASLQLWLGNLPPGVKANPSNVAILLQFIKDFDTLASRLRPPPTQTTEELS